MKMKKKRKKILSKWKKEERKWIETLKKEKYSKQKLNYKGFFLRMTRNLIK